MGNSIEIELVNGMRRHVMHLGKYQVPVSYLDTAPAKASLFETTGKPLTKRETGVKKALEYFLGTLRNGKRDEV